MNEIRIPEIPRMRYKETWDKYCKEAMKIRNYIR